MNNDFEDVNAGPKNIDCYDCSNDMGYKHNIHCKSKNDQYCYFCWNCCQIQHINDENKMTKGHHITCDEHYNCGICHKTTIKEEEDKYNYIDFIENFIFDKDVNTIIKHNNEYYHYECFCKILGKDYMSLVCNICKKHCKNIDDMRDTNDDPKTAKRINVCIECYDSADIRKCYNNYHDINGCKGERVITKCYFYSQCKTYSRGCIKCNKNDWITEYCDSCR